VIPRNVGRLERRAMAYRKRIRLDQEEQDRRAAIIRNGTQRVIAAMDAKVAARMEARRRESEQRRRRT
jgi:hypothetical protein